MNFFYPVLAIALLCIDSALLVNAGLYVVNPLTGSTCRAGRPCTISWLDDGTRPLLPSVGVSAVGLYHGQGRLIQTITPVDVSAVPSISFTPIAAAGPNSDAYYIAITSTTLRVNASTMYSGFSPFFRLVGMSGSFSSPLPSATASIPIPASLTRSSTSSGTRTITVGTLSLSQATPTSPLTSTSTTALASPPSISNSRISTSILSNTPSSTPSTPTQTPTSANAGFAILPSAPLVTLVLLCSSFFLS